MKKEGRKHFVVKSLHIQEIKVGVTFGAFRSAIVVRNMILLSHSRSDNKFDFLIYKSHQKQKFRQVCTKMLTLSHFILHMTKVTTKYVLDIHVYRYINVYTYTDIYILKKFNIFP